MTCIIVSTALAANAFAALDAEFRNTEYHQVSTALAANAFAANGQVTVMFDGNCKFQQP